MQPAAAAGLPERLAGARGGGLAVSPDEPGDKANLSDFKRASLEQLFPDGCVYVPASMRHSETELRLDRSPPRARGASRLYRYEREDTELDRLPANPACTALGQV